MFTFSLFPIAKFFFSVWSWTFSFIRLSPSHSLSLSPFISNTLSVIHSLSSNFLLPNLSNFLHFYYLFIPYFSPSVSVSLCLSVSFFLSFFLSFYFPPLSFTHLHSLYNFLSIFQLFHLFFFSSLFLGGNIINCLFAHQPFDPVWLFSTSILCAYH